MVSCWPRRFDTAMVWWVTNGNSVTLASFFCQALEGNGHVGTRQKRCTGFRGRELNCPPILQCHLFDAPPPSLKLVLFASSHAVVAPGNPRGIARPIPRSGCRHPLSACASSLTPSSSQSNTVTGP
jgi:hypothetical protein